MARPIAFITGASSGIGAALALELGRRGWDLLLMARREDRLNSLVQQLQTLGARGEIAVGDVTREGDVEKAVALAREKWNRPLSLAVANAGFGVVGTVEKLTLEDFRRQFETNIFGVLRTAQAVLPDLKATKGYFGVVGSVNGYVAMPGNSPYGMSKAAVRSLCDSLYHEWRRYDVSVTHIAPGFIDTEIRQVDNRGVWHSGFKDRLPSWLTMSADVAARKTVSALLSRKRERVITFHGWAAMAFIRHLPGLYHTLLGMFRVSSRLAPKSDSPQTQSKG